MTASTPRPCKSVQVGRNRPRQRAAALLLVCACIVGVTPSATAQDVPSSSVPALLKQVALDPTTYAPAILEYDATMRDWNTSQVFFAHGFSERNERFTASGRPNDIPVSYEVGRRRVLGDVLVTMRTSVASNLASHVIENLLARRYPQHRRMVKAVGWIERISLASYWSYQLSATHYRQAQYNDAYARQLGYR